MRDCSERGTSEAMCGANGRAVPAGGCEIPSIVPSFNVFKGSWVSSLSMSKPAQGTRDPTWNTVYSTYANQGN